MEISRLKKAKEINSESPKVYVSELARSLFQSSEKETKQEKNVTIDEISDINPKAKQARIISIAQYQHVAEPEIKAQEWVPSVSYSFGSGITDTKCIEMINDYALINGFQIRIASSPDSKRHRYVITCSRSSKNSRSTKQLHLDPKNRRRVSQSVHCNCSMQINLRLLKIPIVGIFQRLICLIIMSSWRNLRLQLLYILK